MAGLCHTAIHTTISRACPMANGRSGLAGLLQICCGLQPAAAVCSPPCGGGSMSAMGAVWPVAGAMGHAWA
eukprot:scaffold329112_cov111-Tisochrysis_lutea.AAC.1